MGQLRWISKEPIDKGWSGDKKYCATASDGTKYLLRISPGSKRTHREKLFEMQKQLEAIGIPMCNPVEIGTCENGVYTVQSWIDGEDAENFIPRLPESEQYAYGLEAGKILRRIHSVPAPVGQPDWEPRFHAKIDRKIKQYRECPIQIDGADAFISCIEANRGLLAGRPQVFQHGDYHIGNMMISGGKLVIIDFDRFDFGDPWEEFNRIVWCAQACPVFAAGMTDGYFDGRVPLEFWRLLALYISSNMLGSIPWAVPFGQKEIETMLNQAKDVLRWYNGMTELIPGWYPARKID